VRPEPEWKVGPAGPVLDKAADDFFGALKRADDLLEDPHGFDTLHHPFIVTADKLNAEPILWNEANEQLREALKSINETMDPGLHNVRAEHHVSNSEMTEFKRAGGIGTRGHEQLELYNEAIRNYGTRPHLPGHRRELEVFKTQDLDEVEWDVPSMIDAHRNHCTALDEQRSDVLVETTSPPLYCEVSQYMYDPRHEVGPRERAGYRASRRQPTTTTRRKRRGKGK